MSFVPTSPLEGRDPETELLVDRGPGVSITGGGFVALLDPRTGLRGLWHGEDCIAGALAIEVEGGPAPEAMGIRIGPGVWTRDLPLRGGAVLRERGLLPDAAPAAVLQWTLHGAREDAEPASPVRLRIHASLEAAGEGPGFAVPVLPGTEAVVAILAPGEDPERVARLLRPLGARQRQRARRGSADDHEPFALRVDEHRVSSVESALRALDDAPSAGDAPTGPEGPFVVGVRGGQPRYLEGASLAELGLGALVAGRRPVAAAALRALALLDDPPAPPLLHLAAEWSAWTADPEPLRSLRRVLRSASAKREAIDPPAAILPAARSLERLIESLEPLIEPDWMGELRAGLQRHRAPSPGQAPALSLPVLGRVAGGISPLLPLPEAFADPDAPGLASRRTLQGVRLLRSWVEGRLGARPEAAHGRFRLAPRFPEAWRRFEVRGIQVGDAVMSLDYRREGGTLTFLARQEAGGVPLQLVFEPWLADAHVDRVLLGEEIVAVDVAREGAGTRLRCQFPLDAERSVTIVTGR